MVFVSPSLSVRIVSVNDLTCSASPGWPHRMSACRSLGGVSALSAGPAGTTGAAGSAFAAPSADGVDWWKTAGAARALHQHGPRRPFGRYS